MDWHELEKMRVADLREMAKEKTELEGVSALHKDELVAKLAEALGIPRPHKVVEGGGKLELKQKIRELKAERQKAIDARDSAQLKRCAAASTA